MKKYFLCLILFISFNSLRSQVDKVETLKKQLETAKGTLKIDIFNKLMKSEVCKNNNEALAYFKAINIELKQENYVKGRVESIKNYGTLKYCSGDTDSALHFYERAGFLAEKNKLKKIAGAIFNNIGAMYRLKGEVKKSISNFELCYGFGQDLQDTLLILASLDGMGVVYKNMGIFDSALYNFLTVERLAFAPKHATLLLSARINIASLYFSSRPEELEEGYLLETLELSKKLNNQVSQANIIQILGGVSFNKENYNKALEYFEEGLEISKKTGDKNTQAYLFQSIGNVYYKQKQFKKAIEYNQEGITLALEANVNTILPVLYGNTASNFLELKNHRDCIKNSLLGISYLSKSQQRDMSSADLYRYLAEGYRGIGAYKEASDAQLEYAKINNDFRDKSESKQLAELEVEYETEKKETEIASLSQEASIQVLEIKQKNQEIIIGLVVVLFVLSAAYFIYRQRSLKSQQSQTELEQRFLRSQLNPHFISNALMAVQNFMLKNETNKAASYLAKFSKLMREILENSRQEFILIEDELQMLSNFMDIHKMRMNDAFDYRIIINENIDPETDTIPPMFVQPFIENAIEHGVVNAKSDGLIELNFVKNGEYISIEIKDNGEGLVRTEQNIDDHTSLSTTIIKERMELFNKSLKNKIQLLLGDYKNEQGEIQGTKVELKVPFSHV
jgi:tetratricopeptide (TPR) repeat protein